MLMCLLSLQGLDSKTMLAVETTLGTMAALGIFLASTLVRDYTQLRQDMLDLELILVTILDQETLLLVQFSMLNWMLLFLASGFLLELLQALGSARIQRLQELDLQPHILLAQLVI